MWNPIFGQIGFEYYSHGDGAYWYAKWRLCEGAPKSGFKFHVAPQPEDAMVVADSVLCRLRERNAAHKVVCNLVRYIEQWQTEQKGKFITIYTSGAAQGQLVLDAIDPELFALRQSRVIGRGYPPSTRESQHKERELPVGRSGLIFTRWFDEKSRD